jgi:Protein of unknown function (DUF2971)
MRLFHFISEEHALDVIRNQRLKVSQLHDLNDPFELTAVELSDREFRNEYKMFKREMAEKYGILCFSKTWKSPLLWSHYANRHKGVALEFEVLDSVAHSVTYRRNRYVLNYEMQSGHTPPFDKRDIQGIWLTKYKQWEYEDEVRVILRKTECYKQGAMYFYRLGQDIHLKGIVLGPLCDIPIIEIENSLPKNLRISVIQSRLAFRSFNIVKKTSFKKVHLTG